MVKTYLYVPDELGKQLELTAKIQKKSKAEIMKRALEKGITIVHQQGIASAQALLKIAAIGKKYQPTGPKDLSANLDKYLWGKGRYE